MWLYVFIFFAKLVEVSMATVRNVLINRGEKLFGAIIGFFEVMIWLIVVSSVLANVQDDPAKVLVYCFGFACGNYLGIIIENKLAIGNACIQAVVGKESREYLCELLRERGFGVTVIEGQGMEGPVDVLMVYLKRKSVNEAVELIRQSGPDILITVNDVRHMRNGFIRR